MLVIPFSINAIRTLKMNIHTECLNAVQGISNHIQVLIQKYANHTSSLKISVTIENVIFSCNEID